MNSRFLLLLPLAALAGEALADDTAILRCRGIQQAEARLACYDAIAVGSASAPGARPAVAAAAATPAAAALTSFGLEQRQPATAPEELKSRIPGRFQGWEGRARLRLENGQVWEVVDGSRGAYWLESPAVVIRRGTFGGFVMDIEGVAQRLRVRRVE